MSVFRDRFFLLLLGAFAALSLMWGLLLPVHEGPDEQNHYRFIQFLKSEKRLPLQLPLPPECPGQGHQPPLYYALGAAALQWLQPQAAYVELPLNQQLRFNDNPAYFVHYREEGLLQFSGYAVGPHLLRALQLLLSMGSLCLIWMLLAVLPEAGLGPRRLAFAFFALNPGYLFLSGALNNDHLMIFFFTASLLLMLAALEDGDAGPGRALALGLVLGLGLLTKQSALVLLPLAALLAWLRFRRPLASLLAMAAAAAAVAGWFYWRNHALYGDWSGWRMVKETCANTWHEKSPLDLRWWRFWARLSFDSFFSVFGWFSWRLPMAYTWLCLGLTSLSAWGWICGKKSAGQWLLLAAFGLLVLAGIQFDLKFDPPEGRHYYPAMGAMAGLMACGLSRWKAASSPRLAWIFALALLVLNSWLLIYRLIPLYYNVTP